MDNPEGTRWPTCLDVSLCTQLRHYKKPLRNYVIGTHIQCARFSMEYARKRFGTHSLSNFLLSYSCRSLDNHVRTSSNPFRVSMYTFDKDRQNNGLKMLLACNFVTMLYKFLLQGVCILLNGFALYGEICAVRKRNSIFILLVMPCKSK